MEALSHSVTFFEGHLKSVSGMLDLPLDQVTFIFCMLIAWPLAILFSKLPNNPTVKVSRISSFLFPPLAAIIMELMLLCFVWVVMPIFVRINQFRAKFFGHSHLQHIIGGILGIYIAWFIVKWAILHSVVSALVSYAIMHIASRKTAPLIVFVWSVFYMCFGYVTHCSHVSNGPTVTCISCTSVI